MRVLCDEGMACEGVMWYNSVTQWNMARDMTLCHFYSRQVFTNGHNLVFKLV